MTFSNDLLNLCMREPSSGAVEGAKKCLLDTLGVMIKGQTYSSMAPIERFLGNTREIGSSTAIHFGVLPAAEAALYNGTAAHSVEMDDFHRAAAVHPGVVVVPAALAVAQEVSASGEDVLKSAIYGYEAMVRVGEICKGVPYKKGFHPTSLCGVYGASVAASYLYGLTREEAVMALGIAGNFASGLIEYKSNGSWTKRLNAGWAARTGINAAQLARAGFTGPDTILEGRFGFYHAFADRDPMQTVDWNEKKQWATEEITFKPYSSCRFTHAPIDALLKILKRNKIHVESIESIEVRTHEMAVAATLEPKERKYRPIVPVDAQFSIPFCLAVAALYGYVLPEYFESEYFIHNDILQLADKVVGMPDAKYTEIFPRQNGCLVEVRASNYSYTEEILNAKGDPENPFTQEELGTKFRMLTEGLKSADSQEAIIRNVWNMEQFQNLQPLMELLK